MQNVNFNQSMKKLKSGCKHVKTVVNHAASITLPFMASIASFASSALSYFTKPKPRDFPVSLSLITSTDGGNKKRGTSQKRD